MSSIDEYLINHLKTFERWRLRPLLRTRRHPDSSSQNPFMDGETSQDQGGSRESLISDSTHSQTFWQPSLEEALKGLNADDLPEYSALLGACEDGLPFLLDLSNPVPGAILIIGEAGSGKTDLIRSILASAIQMNTPRRVSIDVIAAQPDEYEDVAAALHYQEILPVEGWSVAQKISDLVIIAEKRKRSGPGEPALILAIDDLPALLPFLDEASFNSLYWIIRHGPRYRIWTIAAIGSEQIDQVEPRYLTAFRTRLFGYMHNERLAGRLANDDSIGTRDLDKGHQFLVPYSGDWLRFWICTPGEAYQTEDTGVGYDGGVK